MDKMITYIGEKMRLNKIILFMTCLIKFSGKNLDKKIIDGFKNHANFHSRHTSGSGSVIPVFFHLNITSGISSGLWLK